VTVLGKRAGVTRIVGILMVGLNRIVSNTLTIEVFLPLRSNPTEIVLPPHC